ncbi:MAG: FkbM family methyltransferase [Planctomycetia bacterium]|nr:FkbM family methyltransferase [Planctomycetia bacterium]
MNVVNSIRKRSRRLMERLRPPPPPVLPPAPVRSQVFDLSRKQRVDLDGFSMFVMGEDYVGSSILTARSYEAHVANVVRMLVEPGDVFLDLGANLGFFTMLAASLVGPSGKVISVEPNPQNLQLIYEGILANGFRNVRVLPFAASDVTGILRFVTVGSNGGVVTAHSHCQIHSILVQSAVLDEWLSGEDRLDVVKMDVEAHEPMALRGMVRLVERHRPRILTEFHPWAMHVNNAERPEAYLAQLDGLGYRLSVIHPDGSGCEEMSPAGIMEHYRSLQVETVNLDLLAEPR